MVASKIVACLLNNRKKVSNFVDGGEEGGHQLPGNQTTRSLIFRGADRQEALLSQDGVAKAIIKLCRNRAARRDAKSPTNQSLQDLLQSREHGSDKYHNHCTEEEPFEFAEIPQAEKEENYTERRTLEALPKKETLEWCRCRTRRDETGIANIVIHPDLYERERLLVTRGKLLKVYGKLQNQHGVVHVKADTLYLLEAEAIDLRSHDFH